MALTDGLFWVAFSNFNYLLPLKLESELFASKATVVAMASFVSVLDILCRFLLPNLVDRGYLKANNGYRLGFLLMFLGCAGLNTAVSIFKGFCKSFLQLISAKRVRGSLRPREIERS